MSEVIYVEGEDCNRYGCEGMIVLEETENCSCHINPPCSACMNARLICDTCGWGEGDDEDCDSLED